MEPELHLIECHRFAAMRRVEERSLSSILRSKFLITLINNDIGRKVNAGGRARRLDKFHAIAAAFRVRIGGDQAPVWNFFEVKSDSLLAERCPSH
jgi:hypothetical protein